MNKQLEVGDYVRHTNPRINGGLQMSIEDIRTNTKGETEYQCSHFENAGIHKTDWFNENDLILNKKTDGGFVN